MRRDCPDDAFQDRIVTFSNHAHVVGAMVDDVCEPVQSSISSGGHRHVLRQTILGRFERVEVFPFTVGSLGSWFPPNDEVLRNLHIGWKYTVLMRKLCVASAISGSQNIWYRSTCSQHGTNIPSYIQLPDIPPPSSNLSHSQLLHHH